jgi:hypothetical protein
MSIPFLSNIIIDDAGHIQFKTSAGANAGKIDQDGDNLVLSNAVGDIIIGNGSDDVYIGDGTNAVDIRFEQNMSIYADSSSTRTLTLGGANTNLILDNPTTVGDFVLASKLKFTGATGYILFDYEPTGDTGQYTTEVPLLKVDRSGEETTILARISEYRGVALGADDTVWLRAGDTGSVIRANVGLSHEQVLMSAEGGFIAYGFPSNDTSWSNRVEFQFRTDSGTASDNGLYIGDGGRTQFIDLSRNLVNIGTIDSGDITSTGITISNQNPSLNYTDSSGSTYTAQWRFKDNDLQYVWGGGIKAYFTTSGIGIGDQGNTNDARIEKTGSSPYGLTFKTNNTSALSLDASQNATFAGTIGSGAITSTGKIQGTELEGTSLDINGDANIDGVLDVNTGATNTVALFESTDDKAFIRIKDDDTDTYLITKDGHFSIGDSSTDYNNFKINITNGNVTTNGTITANGTTLTGDQDLSGLAAASHTHAAGDITSGTLAVARGGTGLTANTTYINSNAFANFTATNADYDTLTTRGLYRFQGGANGPASTSHTTGLTLTEDSGNYGWQMASYSSANNTEGLYYRYRATSWGPWQSILTKTIGDGRYAKIASPTFTGTPAAPTASAGTNTTQLATTAFVSTAVSNLVDSAPGTLNTLNELAAALGDDASFSTTTATALANRVRVDTASQGLTSTEKSNARTNIGAGTSSFDGAYGSLSGIPTSFTPAQHTQAISTITNLQTELDAKMPKTGGSFTGDVTITHADTPRLSIIDTTNDVDFRIRAANSYVYIEADTDNDAASTRFNFKVDGGLVHEILPTSQISHGNFTIRKDDATAKAVLDLSTRKDITGSGNFGTGDDVGVINFKARDSVVTSDLTVGSLLVEADNTFAANDKKTRMKMQVYTGSALENVLFLDSDKSATFYGNIITSGTVDGVDVATLKSDFDGLGTAANFASSAFATSTQGTKADNALPKAGGTMTGDLTLDDGSGESPHIIFQDDDDVKFRVYNADNNDFIITRENNSGADFVIRANSTAYTSSYLTIGGATVSPTAIGNWNTAYSHSQAAHAPSNAEQNVQSDWNATSGDAFILNKPTIPTASSLGAVTKTGTQTISGAKTFTSNNNHYKGHLYYDAYDSGGNHYPHFLDGTGNTGATINWRQYYGSTYKTHTWTSDSSGNMAFTFQGQIKANGELEGTSLDINGNADVSGTLNIHDEILTTAAGSLLEMYKSAWTNATNHDVLYSSWNTYAGDYLYLKAPGNSTNDHGIALIGDDVIAFGRSDVETGSPELTSAAAPLSENWFVLNSSSATFSGDVTANGTLLTGAPTGDQVTTALGFTPMNSVTTTISSGQAQKLGYISVSQAVDLDDMETKAANGNTAHGWGNHATAGYLTPSSTQSKYLRSDQSDTTTGSLTINGDLTVQGINYGLYHADNISSTESGSSNNYYHDHYGGVRHLSTFIKNAKSDIIRYRAIDNVEYWNGSSWQDGSSQLANVKKLLDGRQDTRWDITSTYYKFRFTVTPSTGWPTETKIGTQTSWSGSTYPGHRLMVEEYSSGSWSTRVIAKFGGSNTTIETTDNNCDNWGMNFYSTNRLHTGNGAASQATRITVDFYGWTPSNSSYLTIPLQNIFITSNYSGTENTDYTNLLDYDRNVSIAGNIVMASGKTVDGVDISALPTTFAPTNADATPSWVPSSDPSYTPNALPLAGGTMTGDTSHGDNVKSHYGTGSDLSIYHKSGESFIGGGGPDDLFLSQTKGYIYIGTADKTTSTLYIDSQAKKVGFRTQTPGSAFDVNGTMRVRNQLNVGHTSEQNLYVHGDGTAGGRYVKMGDYGKGNYFSMSSTENQPKYCTAFGSGGKLVEDTRIVTIKLSGDAFKLLSTTGTTLIPAPGANSFIIPYECIIHNTGGTSGNWNSTAQTTAAIGFCDTTNCTYPGQFNRLFVINNTLLNTNAAWYYAAGIGTTGKVMALNKPLLLKASQNLTTVPTGNWYIQIRYQVMNKDSGLIQNVDITKTTN